MASKPNILKELRDMLFKKKEQHFQHAHDQCQIIATRQHVKKLEQRQMSLREIAVKVGLVSSLDVRIPRGWRRELVTELQTAGWFTCRCRACRVVWVENRVWVPECWVCTDGCA